MTACPAAPIAEEGTTAAKTRNQTNNHDIRNVCNISLKHMHCCALCSRIGGLVPVRGNWVVRWRWLHGRSASRAPQAPILA